MLEERGEDAAVPMPQRGADIATTEPEAEDLKPNTPQEAQYSDAEEDPPTPTVACSRVTRSTKRTPRSPSQATWLPTRGSDGGRRERAGDAAQLRPGVAA